MSMIGKLVIELHDALAAKDAEIERLKAEKQERDDRIAFQDATATARMVTIRELEEACRLLKMLLGHPQTTIKHEPGGALVQCALDNDGVRNLHQTHTRHPEWFTNPLPSVSPSPKEFTC